jgi:hypothetical protein
MAFRLRLSRFVRAFYAAWLLFVLLLLGLGQLTKAGSRGEPEPSRVATSR